MLTRLWLWIGRLLGRLLLALRLLGLLAAAQRHGLDTPCLEALYGYLAHGSVTLR